MTTTLPVVVVVVTWHVLGQQAPLMQLSSSLQHVCPPPFALGGVPQTFCDLQQEWTPPAAIGAERIQISPPLQHVGPPGGPQQIRPLGQHVLPQHRPPRQQTTAAVAGFMHAVPGLVAA